MIPERATDAAGRVLGWLRAGYPEGQASGEYVALFAVLHRRLDDEEVEHVCRDLLASAAESGTGIDAAAVRAAIRDRACEKPGEEDVEQVIRCLAEHGWDVSLAG